ncbi:MAG: tRNA uridine-5-carboxymethylaminomethyl(34) synthesis enzyme MnmG [Candidatus Omnitrophica bacterium]|jgi:tRNA uridine 5-carboxymethylaminomethyl modification enzyme|nr:tRNA uridine-5-carboxymethylaminomethyl(34) synthesis enzyme MnmG [Candidatus Omnitrophota bacterium]
MNKYDFLVIGAGHAGIEAAFAASNMGCKTLMLVLDAKSVGRLSCNPAIGGVGKGQLVKEIDALGGQMAVAADASGIQFRTLNASRGQAVQSSRAQVDMDAYSLYMQRLVKKQKNLWLKEAQVKKLIVNDAAVCGVVTDKETIFAESVAVCAGTFLNGLIHLGLKHHSGGRVNEIASCALAEDLKSLGLNLFRFKTGTCPRLDKQTIDFSKLIIQHGDCPARPFSFATRSIKRKQVPCYITYTNELTHKIIRDNLKYSPLYSGIITSTGVRYCPSIEDKVVKFSEKNRHQVFLEPQGLKTNAIYPNGLSTSLPEEIQLKLLHSIPGLEEACVIRFGYGIEHTVVDSTQLFPTLESKLIKGLFFAGQVNGTTGYEEAAAQGIVAGINAALKIRKEKSFILERADGYIGVLIDDLTTKGTNEPYRMFTSRVEYRLLLREDNADLRLSKKGFQLGLINKNVYRKVLAKAEAIQKGIHYLRKTRVKSIGHFNEKLKKQNLQELKKSVTLEELLKRPPVKLADLKALNLLPKGIAESAWQQVEIEIKYAGFIQRQLKDVERFKHLEKIKLPLDFDYRNLSGISREIKEKLAKFKPLNLGQASRISGVTPAAVSLLMVYIGRLKRTNG